jgi:hypothetical protein
VKALLPRQSPVGKPRYKNCRCYRKVTADQRPRNTATKR